MPKSTNSFRVFLSTFSGEDNFIIKKCSVSIQITFALIGLFVIAIFIGCFVSAYYFFNSLFQDNFFVSFPIGITWALLVTNMYLLLLYTVSPAILPTKKQKEGINNNFFTLSMFFRICFMSLLAIIIAQPLNVIFFTNSVETSLQKHTQQEKTKMIIVADSLLIKNEILLFKDFNELVKLNCSNIQIHEIKANMLLIENKIKNDSLFIHKSKALLAKFNKLDNKIWLNKSENNIKSNLLEKLSALTDSQILSDNDFIDNIDNTQIANQSLRTDFGKYKNNLKVAINQKLDNYQKLDYLLSQSNFYIKRIQLILFENPRSWLVTFVICLIFLLPIYFKYKVRDKTGFYDKKIEIEKKIVMEEYSKFKIIYSKLLQNNIVKYNYKSLKELQSYLLKLKTISPRKSKVLEKHINEEYKEEIIAKYEYWADNPFRTINKFDHKNLANESDFLETLYTQEI